MVLIESPSLIDYEPISRVNYSGILTEEENNNSDDGKLMSPTHLNEASITASTPQRRSEEPPSIRHSEEASEIDSFKFSSGSSDDDTNLVNNDITPGEDDAAWRKETIPQVGKKLTPWRQDHVSVSRTDPQFDRSRGSPPKVRDPSIKPQVIPTTLDTRPVNFKSMISPIELDGLRNQLKKYKIKVASLEEVIKNINQSDGLIKEDPSLFYEKLLKIIDEKTMTDDNTPSVEKLVNDNKKMKKELSKTNKKLSNLSKDFNEINKELETTRKEYEETLSMTDEHFKDVDKMNSTLNVMLEDLIAAMRQNSNHDKFEDVLPVLQNALGQKSDYMLNKLLHFQNYWVEVIQSPKFQQRNILPIDGPSEDPLERDEGDHTKDTIENTSVLSLLSPQAESIIEELHKQYDSYMLDVKSKLKNTSSLLDILMKKLAQQDKILAQLPLAIAKNKDVDRTMDNSRNLDTINASISQLSAEFQNKLTSTETEFSRTIEDVTAAYKGVVYDTTQQYKATEKEHIRIIRQLMNERDSINDKFDSLQDEFNQLRQHNITYKNTKDRDFSSLKQSLVFCLTSIIDILEPVLEKESIEKSYKKIDFIKSPDNGWDNILQIQMKIESLLRFNEKALKFLTESYTSYIVNSPLSPLAISPSVKSPLSPTESERDSLRIKELEKILSSERETRSIESHVIEQRMNKLELENQKLKELLEQSTQDEEE